MKVHKLSASDEVSWMLMPQLLMRADAFCRRYNTDTKSEVLIPHLKQEFASHSDGTLAIVAHDDNYAVVGHVVCLWYKEQSDVLVLQLQFDGLMPKAVFAEGWQIVLAFAASHEAKRIRLVTHRVPKHVRSGFERWGFKPRLLTMVVDL